MAEGIDQQSLQIANFLQSLKNEIKEEQSMALITYIVQRIAFESVSKRKRHVLAEYMRRFVNDLGFSEQFSVSKTKEMFKILIALWQQSHVARYVITEVYCDNIPDFDQHDQLDIFAKALKDGYEQVKNIRLMVVGMFGVGKTSLVNNLVKDLRDENLTVESTEGIELRRCQLMKNGDWCLDKDQKDAKYRHRYVDALKRAQKPTEIEPPSNVTSILEEPDFHPDINEPVIEEPPVPWEEIKKRVEESKDQKEIITIIELAEKEPETIKVNPVNIPVPVGKTDITVSVWDFAGQTLYYSTHQFFLNKRSIYLVLMDMTKGLDECVKEDEISGIWCGLSEECTYLDVFKFWLNAIHMYSGYMSGTMTGTISPTVILVGTHKDKMEGTDKEKEIKKDKYFEKALKPFRGALILQHIYKKKFLVNNLSSEDPVFKKIRREIRRLAEVQDYWNENYPVRWIQMEQSLDKLRDKGVKLLQRTELDAENQLNIIPLEKELDLFLEIQHGHGNILYFNTEQLKQLIVLAPQWIIEVFKCFITQKRNKDPNLSEHWTLYEELAILKQEVFNEIMDTSPNNVKENREHIMMYMEHLHVMAKPLLSEEAKEINDPQEPEQDTIDFDEQLNAKFLDFHIVPCRLKNPPPPISMFTLPASCKNTPVLCFVFVDNFMPPSFFHRLVAVCIRTWPISKINKKDSLYNGLAVFDLRSAYFLTIWYTDHIIYARISSYSNAIISDLDFKLCQGVLLKLRKSLVKYVTQSLENPWAGRGFEEYIQCPYI